MVEYINQGGEYMEDIKAIVAKNIAELRLLNNMTQLELAQKLNYSDKTISKWERGESVPDVAVLAEIADMFGVTLDYMIKTEHAEEEVRTKDIIRHRYNRLAITSIAQGLVWFISLFAFILTSLIAKDATFQWLYFVYSVPVSFILLLVLNSIWFNPRNNYLIISLLMWSVLASVHISFWYFSVNISMIYLLGIAGQLMIILWSLIKKPHRN